MPIFFRLLRFSMRYRWRFTLGIVVSFFVAFLNGLSMTSLVPLFDALGDRGDLFAMQFTDRERALLDRALHNNPELTLFPQLRPVVPKSPEIIDASRAKDILHWTRGDYTFGVSDVERVQMRTILTAKLKINAAAYPPFKVVVSAAVIVLPLYLLKLLLLLISVRLIARTGYLAVRDIRESLYRSMQRLPLTFFYREKSGLLVSRMVNDAEVVAAVISSNLRDAVTNIFYILVHVVILAYLNFELLIVSIIALPLILSPVTLFSGKIYRSTTRSQELLADLNGHLQEALAGMRVIRNFGREEHEKSRFAAVNQRLYWRTFKQQFYLRSAPNLVELTSALVVVGIIALGAIFLDPANFTSGEFIAFLLVLLFIIRPIIQLSGMYSKIYQSIAAGERIFSIIDHEPELHDPAQPVRVEPLRESIEFRDLWFRYPESEKMVIKGLNCKVQAGQTVALVGESGGGKSTLMDLLARFFDPVAGQILIDGHDTRDYAVREHRQRIGIVTQEIFLFYGTIRENIAYGRADISQEEIEKVSKLANAHDFIMEFEHGYDTFVGERGATLSGGQRQRIAISRALLRDPEILILDEATSALDTENEKLVQQALERLFKDRTTFVIAHRLSTIEKSDQILVISQGELAEIGTHKELMNKGGLYARLQQIGRQAALGNTA